MESTPEEKIFEQMLEFFQSGKEYWHKDQITKAIQSFKAELGWTGIAQESWSQVVKCWNSFQRLPKVVSLSATRQRIVNARLKDKYFRTHYQEAIVQIQQSPFLMGQNKSGWVANFDWFIQPDSVSKIMEGRYADKTATVALTMQAPKKEPTSFELEKSLKFIETEIERLKGEKIYIKDTGMWMPNPENAPRLKELFQKRKDLIQKRINLA